MDYVWNTIDQLPWSRSTARDRIHILPKPPINMLNCLPLAYRNSTPYLRIGVKILMITLDPPPWLLISRFLSFDWLIEKKLRVISLPDCQNDSSREIRIPIFSKSGKYVFLKITIGKAGGQGEIGKIPPKSGKLAGMTHTGIHKFIVSLSINSICGLRYKEYCSINTNAMICDKHALIIIIVW